MSIEQEPTTQPVQRIDDAWERENIPRPMAQTSSLAEEAPREIYVPDHPLDGPSTLRQFFTRLRKAARIELEAPDAHGQDNGSHYRTLF